MRGHRRNRAIGLIAATALVWLSLAPLAGAANVTPAAGPPYPSAVTGQRVYDYAGIFSPASIASAEAVSAAIEKRTGAQVAVYTQVKPESDTTDAADSDALALMNQWGVGRKGFDDGLVIVFDMQANLRHGQVALYAGSGFRAAYLTNADRQSIFDNDMKPKLLEADFDGALAIAMSDIDSAATPARADELSRDRTFNALVGLLGALIALGLCGFVVLRWYRHGRDPYYADDSSVLMPAPPDGLTPAMATLLMTDKTSNRTVSAAMVDLAARGLVQFRQSSAFLGKKTSVGATGVEHLVTTPESILLSWITARTGIDGYIDPASMAGLGPGVVEFKTRLETFAVEKGWMTGPSTAVVGNWIGLAIGEAVVAAAMGFWTYRLDASGGFIGTVGFGAAAIFTGVMAQFMPSRTPEGSMLRAMLAAYRRTLQATMAAAGSMNEVVDSKALPWITTPDAAMAWGVAFGLNAEIDAVMQRSVGTGREAAARGVGRAVWFPVWWSGPGGSFGGGGGSGSGGMFSSSAIPDVGSMVAAIGSIGASTSGGGGGGFGGGGGGGGGGAGGGF
jgi:uncharacterized membrane protein YgcG